MQSHRLPSNYFSHFRKGGSEAFGSGSFAEVESANDLRAWRLEQGSLAGGLCGAVPFAVQHRHPHAALPIPGAAPGAGFS